jgi:hypothetical protein
MDAILCVCKFDCCRLTCFYGLIILIYLSWVLVTFHSFVSREPFYLGDCEDHSHEIFTALSGKLFHYSIYMPCIYHFSYLHITADLILPRAVIYQFQWIFRKISSRQSFICLLQQVEAESSTDIQYRLHFSLPRVSDPYFTFTSSPKRKAISSCWQVVDSMLPASGSLNATSSKTR